MNEFLLMRLGLLVIIGASVILGIATRGTSDGEDKDHIFMVIMRGFATLAAVFFVISTVGAIIYLISSAFK